MFTIHSSWSDWRQSGASSVKLRFVRELQRTDESVNKSDAVALMKTDVH